MTILKTSKRLVWVIALVMASALVAAPAMADKPNGNPIKGKYSYKQVYKDCHARGEISEKKPTVDPSSKTRAQWARVFDKKEFGSMGCSQEWGTLTDGELANIHAYLYKGAADSPTPAKCK